MSTNKTPTTYNVPLTLGQIVEITTTVKERHANLKWSAARTAKEGEELATWEVKDRDAAIAKRTSLEALYEVLTGEPLVEE